MFERSIMGLQLLALGDMEWTLYITFSTIFIIILFLTAITTILIVLFQKSNSDGIQGITASSETFFGKNKGRSLEAKLKKWTWVCLGILAVLSIAAYIIGVIVH